MNGHAMTRLRRSGHVGITDVIILMGYYTSISMTLAFYDVPAGAPGMAR
jgi:4-carboxymuconolactone decarboxylase